jgi:hypothetical protein
MHGSSFSCLITDRYETTPKWHGFLVIRLAAAMAWIKQRTAACDEPFGCERKAKKLRVERLSRIEYRISKDGIASLHLFNKKDRIHSFDIRHSLFDIRFFKVSFSIKLAFFGPAAGLTPILCVTK